MKRECKALPLRTALQRVVVLCAALAVGCGALAASRVPSTAPPVRQRAPAHWSIGIMQGPDLFSLKELAGCPNPRITRESVSLPESTFVADPFLVRHDQEWFLFFELFNAQRGKGEIGVAHSTDLCTWKYRGVVLSEESHLSYPHVFQHNGHYFMIPESKQAGDVRLYVATSFPYTWKLKEVLVKEELVDTTALYRNKRWWLFANRSPYSLAIFSSPRLTGPFREHPTSPLFVDDPARARPAGAIVLLDGLPIRFVQDNREGYGKRVRAVKVLSMDLTSYHEGLLTPDPFLSEGRSGWNSFGMHHISALQREDGSWVAAVDGNSRETHTDGGCPGSLWGGC